MLATRKVHRGGGMPLRGRFTEIDDLSVRCRRERGLIVASADVDDLVDVVYDRRGVVALSVVACGDRGPLTPVGDVQEPGHILGAGHEDLAVGRNVHPWKQRKRGRILARESSDLKPVTVTP